MSQQILCWPCLLWRVGFLYNIHTQQPAIMIYVMTIVECHSVSVKIQWIFTSKRMTQRMPLTTYVIAYVNR